jgi:hypothetical protein
MATSGSIWEGYRLDATVITCRDDLVAIVRKRQDELNISCETVDQLAGLADRHFSKLTSKVKGFGFMSTFVVLKALGLRLRVEEDPDAIARLRHRWTPRLYGARNLAARGARRSRSRPMMTVRIGRRLSGK